jgi:hypothetical protein
MTIEEARIIAKREADAYARAEDKGNHEFGLPWIMEWYDYETEGTLIFRSHRRDDTIEELAQQIMLRSTPLYKALDEN